MVVGEQSKLLLLDIVVLLVLEERMVCLRLVRWVAIDLDVVKVVRMVRPML